MFNEAADQRLKLSLNDGFYGTTPLDINNEKLGGYFGPSRLCISNFNMLQCCILYSSTDLNLKRPLLARFSLIWKTENLKLITLDKSLFIIPVYFSSTWCHIHNKYAFVLWVAELNMRVGPEKKWPNPLCHHQTAQFDDQWRCRKKEDEYSTCS